MGGFSHGEKGIRFKSVALDRRCEQGPLGRMMSLSAISGWEGAAFLRDDLQARRPARTEMMESNVHWFPCYGIISVTRFFFAQNILHFIGDK